MNLSIIIPTYNRNQSLIKCLQALEHNDAEFLVVDDGSALPVEAPSNVRILRHPYNRGRAAAINTGLRAALHDLVLILDDDIHAAPDMVLRLVHEFLTTNNPKLALVGRVAWDPRISRTLTMQWMEAVGPFNEISSKQGGAISGLFTGNTVLSRSFVLNHGGFDENFIEHGLEDTELGIRLKPQGLEVRLLPSAYGYHHKMMKVHDLVNRQLQEGLGAVYLNSKIPGCISQVDDVRALQQNLEKQSEVEAAVEQIALLEQVPASDATPFANPELFMLIYQYYSFKGILDGLKTMGAVRRSSSSSATLGLYDEASHLESRNELGEARRMFQLVRERQDKEYWAAAEYHLGRIESQYGNESAAQMHFKDCLRLDPDYGKARDVLMS